LPALDGARIHQRGEVVVDAALVSDDPVM